MDRHLCSYMKKLILWSLALLSLWSCKEQMPGNEPESNTREDPPVIDRTYRPFLHSFTSTGCGVCARFGIPVFQEVASEMGDSILPLITHFKYNDPFINQSSLTIEKAIVQHYSSPQIWIENEEITRKIIGKEISEAAEWCKTALRKETNKNADAYLGLEAAHNERGRFDLAIAVENASGESKTYHIEVYGHEDSIWASQSGTWPPPHHYWVNRGGHYGGMGKKVELSVGAVFSDRFEYIPCSDCKTGNMYFLAIVWEQMPDESYRYVNGRLIRMP